ncbi:MAG TPA: hypothetical protein VLK36_14995 [Gaiellaceae bacterium]|nr:hypothetical protein [Gaiellaceae bacterium]
MGDEGAERSHDLERVRELLFADLPVEEGWERIAAAIVGAADPERQQVIERLAARDLSGDLLDILRRLRDEDDEEEDD